jgi:hypothetical protein
MAGLHWRRPSAPFSIKEPVVAIRFTATGVPKHRADLPDQPLSLYQHGAYEIKPDVESSPKCLEFAATGVANCQQGRQLAFVSANLHHLV